MRPIALVTGSTSGIGLEFAHRLAGRGYDLVLVARDGTRLGKLAAELQSAHGTQCEITVADLSRDEDTSRVVARIDRGDIALLVNNAGFGTKGTLARTQRGPQDDMIRLHVLAVHRLTQAAVQSMVPRGGGAIITVASVASFLVSPGNVNYTSTKAWQRIQMEALSTELRKTGVYVQALCPGYTHTEFHARGEMNMSRYPAWIWQTVGYVVDRSLAALDRRRPVVVVPGPGYRAVSLLLRLMPAGLMRWIVSRRGGRRRASVRT